MIVFLTWKTLPYLLLHFLQVSAQTISYQNLSLTTLYKMVLPIPPPSFCFHFLHTLFILGILYIYLFSSYLFPFMRRWAPWDLRFCPFSPQLNFYCLQQSLYLTYKKCFTNTYWKYWLNEYYKLLFHLRLYFWDLLMFFVLIHFFFHCCVVVSWMAISQFIILVW